MLVSSIRLLIINAEMQAHVKAAVKIIGDAGLGVSLVGKKGPLASEVV